MSGIVSILAGVGMAVGPPLIYSEQAYSIVKRKDSSGFSFDVCAVLLIANITRCVFWLGKRFELALLMQSVFLILAMLALLFILIKYRRPSSKPNKSPRPLNFWQWESYGQYIEFLAGLIVFLCIPYLILGGYDWFVDALGFIALGIESQLPTPQAISNFQRKSTAGLKASVIAGWLGGDLYKTFYFWMRGSPAQFLICGLITVSIDLVIVAQRFYYGTDGEGGASPSDDDDVERGEGGEESRALRSDADER